MNKGGGIIRLIDVVLILLLGFLQVSDIVHKKQIKLPGKTSSKKDSNDANKTLPIEIYIIDADTTIDAIDPATETSLKVKGQLHCYYLLKENKETFRIRMLDNLEKHLVTAKLNYDSLAIIISPKPNSMIQGTISLIDICRKYGLKRKFKYVEENEG